MTTADTEIVLGRLHTRATSDDEPRHQLLYLPDRDTIVMPFCRSTRDGWHCVVVATRDRHHDNQILLTDAQLAAARSSMPGPGDPESFAKLVWTSQVFRRWPGGTVLAVARVLARELRRPGTLTVPAGALRDHALIARRLAPTQPAAVDAAISELVTAGYVARSTDGLWQLTTPTTDHGAPSRRSTVDSR